MVYPPEIKFFSSVVYRHDWEVVTIRKHIGSDKALACACEGVGVDESMVCGVVVAGLEVVEAGFGVVDVAAVAQGVAADEAGRGGSPSDGGIRGHVAPRVVGAVPVAAYGCPRPTGSFALACHVPALLAMTGQTTPLAIARLADARQRCRMLQVFGECLYRHAVLLRSTEIKKVCLRSYPAAGRWQYWSCVVNEAALYKAFPLRNDIPIRPVPAKR